VLDYTLDQIKGFLGAIDRAERIKRMSDLALLRAAQYDKDNFRKVWRQMRREAGLPVN